MNETEAYERGLERGRFFGEASFEGWDMIAETEDEAVDAAFAAEENDRQFSPFEFLAKELNNLSEEESDACWERFEEGISEGIEKAFKEGTDNL